MYVKCTRSVPVLVEHINDNFYARFHNPSHHRYRAHTLVLSQRKILTVIGALNVGQWYVNEHACGACQGQSLCKVS